MHKKGYDTDGVYKEIFCNFTLNQDGDVPLFLIFEDN